jgi:hypothetical protein
MIFWLILFMNKYQRLVNEYAYPGFRPLSRVQIYPGKIDARIITLRRRQKKTYAAAVVKGIIHFTIGRTSLFGIFPVEMPVFTLELKYGESNARYAAE